MSPRRYLDHQPLTGAPGLAIARNGKTLYCSIYRRTHQADRRRLPAPNHAASAPQVRGRRQLFVVSRPTLRYGALMIRSLAAISSVLAICSIGVSHASLSKASPSDGQCSFVLSTPKVVQIAGVDFATATVNPGPCGVRGHNQTVVCLSIEGDDSPGQCVRSLDPTPAAVYIPYRRGATYVAKGEGCIDRTVPVPSEDCRVIPASRVTL